MPRRTAGIDIVGRIDRYRREINKLPSVTQSAAKKSSTVLEKEIGGGTKRAGKAGVKAGRDVGKAFASAKNIAVALAGITALAGGFFAAQQKIADFRNELLDASARSGIAAETLNGLKLAAEGSGLQFTQLSKGLDKFPKRMRDAAMGSKVLADTFKQLNVELLDSNGQLRDSDSTFKEAIANLARVESQSERSAIATELFGSAGTKLLQALGDTRSLDAFIESANAFGVSVAPQAAKASADWQRSMGALKNVFRGALTELFDFGSEGADVLDFFSATIVFTTSVVEDSVALWLKSFKTFTGGFAKLVKGDFAGAFDDLTVGFRVLSDNSIPNIIDAAQEQGAEFIRLKEKTDELAGGNTRLAGSLGSLSQAFEKTTKVIKPTRVIFGEWKKELDEQIKTAEKFEAANLGALDKITKAAIENNRVFEKTTALRNAGILSETDARRAQIDALNKVRDAERATFDLTGQTDLIEAQIRSNDLRARNARLIEDGAISQGQAEAAQLGALRDIRRELEDGSLARLEGLDLVVQAQENYNEVLRQTELLVMQGRLTEEQSEAARLAALQNLQFQEREASQERLKALKEQTTLALDSGSEIIGSLEDVFSKQSDNERLIREQQRRNFRIAKGLAFAQIALSTAAGIMKVVEQTGVGAVLAAPAVAITAAIQLAAVAGTKFPTAHVGGALPQAPLQPDEQVVRITKQEKVVTRTEQLQNVGGQPEVMQLVVGHRVMDTINRDQVRRGGALGASLRRKVGRRANSGR